MMRWLGPCIVVALGSLGCGQSRLLDDLTTGATRIRLEPESFRGNVPCTAGVAGALQTYSVTFREARLSPTQTDAGLYSGTSGPAPCNRAVLLDALPGTFYVADIYGFDRVFSDTAPELDQARWTAHCGLGDGSTNPPDAGVFGGPTLAIYGVVVPMTGCTRFGGSTQLIVDPEAGALGDLSCGSGPGQVSRLEGVLGETRVSAPCGQPLVFDVPSTAQFYTIELTAFEASPRGSTPPPLGGASDLLDASIPASLTDAADAAPADGGGLDAGLPPAPGQGADSGAADAGQDPGIARWRSQCTGDSVPGTRALASCEPLQTIP